MKTRIYVLLGGLQSWDGFATSRGMFGLIGRIKDAGYPVEYWYWSDYLACYSALMSRLKSDDKLILVGYSGGAAHATWLARGYDYRTDVVMLNKKQEYSLPKPRIDLLVSYDASPKNGVFDISNTRVKRAVCYYNEAPLMFGLGGGRITGNQVEEIPIRMQHLAVQYSTNLHDRTMKEIEKTSSTQEGNHVA